MGAIGVLRRRVFGAAVGFVAAWFLGIVPCSWARSDEQAPVGRFDVPEISGLVASRRHRDVYWALQDSGPGPREALFAIRLRRGQLLPWPDGRKIRRIRLRGAPNRDWEELAIDARGNLWIADCGNNREQRNDLALLRVLEPDPWRDLETVVSERVPFRYPDTPSWGRSFDAEALFVYGERMYLITKTAEHGLYRLPAQRNRTEANLLEKLGRLTPPPRGFGGLVTGAAIAEDGRRLAVTAGRRWAYVYEAPQDSDHLRRVQALVAQAPRWAVPYTPDAKPFQVEAVAFKPGSHALVFAAEEGFIWSFSASFYQRFNL
jgi:hypothetical protein